MQCPQCHSENRPGRRFCGDCGASLARTCAACGFLNESGERFCGGCGAPIASATAAAPPRPPQAYTPAHLAEKIAASRSALEGERKQITVLFADLKGSMELLADRDPEDARRVLDPVLALMMEAVHRYEGTVNQVMGDGVMALFGAPIAHEDHAVRACYAALRMQALVHRYAEDARRAHGANVQIRIGVNSGEVVVRAIGGDLRMDYTAVGQTTHLAARMEQLASPGSTLITASTLELVEGYVAVKRLGPVPVKGLAEPVDVYEVTGAGPARTRFEASAWRGLTRFVGRDSQVALLRGAQQLAGDGHGQVAAVVGEAGMGKSRLVYEFIHACRLDGWSVLETSAVAYGKATSYLPVIDLLKTYFKIEERNDRSEIRDKVAGTLRTLDRGLEPSLHPLLALLDVPVDEPAWTALDPAQRRQRTLDAVRRLLLRYAREQPLLVVFEDLHWIDSETQALLDGLIDSLASARVLLLVNYRPEYQHPWGGKTYYSQIRLDTLSAESAEKLLGVLLGEDPGLTPLKQMLVKQGNPFFLEETVRTLVETKALAGERGQYRLTQPVHAIQVPATVQAILAARIDRLGPEDKHVLQVASVVGKDVPFALLQAIADLPDEALRRGLERLQAAEFLYETELFPGLEYSFKHALTHDVAYGGLLQERRRALHARIVESIETLHGGRLGEHVERLAHHALRGELREQAVLYLREAALKARARWALQDAAVWFEQALDVLGQLPESRSTLEDAFEIRLELRTVLAQLGDIRGTLARLREAETLAERLDDDRQRGRVGVFVINVYSALGEPDEACARGNRTLAIARALEDRELIILATTYLAQAHYYRGEYARVVTLAGENLATMSPGAINEYIGNADPPWVFDSALLILTLAELGRFAEAAQYEAEMVRLAEPTHHPYTIGLARLYAGGHHLIKGDWAKARALLEDGIEVMRAGNVVLLLPATVARCALALAHVGDTANAVGRIEEGERLLDRLAAQGWIGGNSFNYQALGRAALRLGRLDDAERLARRALDAAPQHPGFAAHALHLRADIASHPTRADARSAEADYRQALALAGPRGMRPLIAHCELGLGTLHGLAGHREEARQYLLAAETMYRELGMDYWLARAQAVDPADPRSSVRAEGHEPP